MILTVLFLDTLCCYVFLEFCTDSKNLTKNKKVVLRKKLFVFSTIQHCILQSDDLFFDNDGNLFLACIWYCNGYCITKLIDDKCIWQYQLTVLHYVVVFMSPSVFGVAHVLADRSIEKLSLLSFYFSGHSRRAEEAFWQPSLPQENAVKVSHFLSLHSLTNTPI